MYSQAQPSVTVPMQGQAHVKYSPVGGGEDANAALCGGGGGGGGGESIENSQIVDFDEGSTIGDLDGVEVVPHDSMYSGGAGAVCSEGMGLTQSGDVSNQLSLSFQGQVYVFDSVTTEKVLYYLDFLFFKTKDHLFIFSSFSFLGISCFPLAGNCFDYKF